MKTVASFFIFLFLLSGSTSSARVMLDHGVRLGESCARTEQGNVLIQYENASGMTCNGRFWESLRFEQVCARFGSVDSDNSGRCLCSDGGSFVAGTEINCREL